MRYPAYSASRARTKTFHVENGTQQNDIIVVWAEIDDEKRAGTRDEPVYPNTPFSIAVWRCAPGHGRDAVATVVPIQRHDDNRAYRGSLPWESRIRVRVLYDLRLYDRFLLLFFFKFFCVSCEYNDLMPKITLYLAVACCGTRRNYCNIIIIVECAQRRHVPLYCFILYDVL